MPSPPAVSLTGGTKPGVASSTPAARHFATMAACQSTSNHSRSDLAIVGPTSSTVTSSASGAAAMASTEPNAVASARAAVGPMCRIDSATRIRQSGRCRASSRLPSSLVAFAVSEPPLVTKNGTVLKASAVSPNRSPSSVTSPESSSATAAS